MDCLCLRPLVKIFVFYFPLTPAEKPDQHTTVLIFFSEIKKITYVTRITTGILLDSQMAAI